jgi:hypothetical protein
MSLDLKWRFFEKDGWGLALKPGITLPTGNEDRGLGGGRTTYRLFFITTKELEPWAFHLNLGYIRNENNAGVRSDLWHALLAGEVDPVENLKAVNNIGIETNPTPGSTHPVFALGGLIYELSETVSLGDMGRTKRRSPLHVGNGPGDLQDPGMGAGGEPQPHSCRASSRNVFHGITRMPSVR